MLHDIGRGMSHTILHAQLGADLLRAEGISEEIARIVECHTGAGLTADECTLLRLSPRDCMPRTTEEKIVTHADNLIEGRKRVTIDESIASAIHLPRKVRNRMYLLSQEVELALQRKNWQEKSSESTIKNQKTGSFQSVRIFLSHSFSYSSWTGNIFYRILSSCSGISRKIFIRFFFGGELPAGGQSHAVRVL